jgi:hypothetical protein
MADKLWMMAGKTVYDIFSVLKHRKFRIDSDFATTDKTDIHSRHLLVCSDMGIKIPYIS